MPDRTDLGAHDDAPLLGAVLIVRDEQDNLADCLAPLDGIVEEVIVHDTGSSDATVDIARSAGARVTEGPWPNDFAAARNTALTAATSRWVLQVDADDRLVVTDRTRLTELLDAADRDGVTTLLIEIANSLPIEDGSSYTHREGRLFRRQALATSASSMSTSPMETVNATAKPTVR